MSPLRVGYPSIFKCTLLLLVLLGFSSCGSVKYLFQATRGQLALANHARPIPEVLKDEKVPKRIKALLTEIGPIKNYLEKQGFKATSNYSEYVKLNRGAAVWVVSACESLRFKPKQWKFPIVGSFPYLGWFDLDDAKKYAEELRGEGWDVDVRGASAYSTLGWFRDSVLSTMISEGEDALGHLTNVVIHESVHATVYISGQSYFNESLASFVADEMTPVYLDQIKGAQSPEKTAYLEAEKKSEHKTLRLHEVYKELDQVYSSNDSDQEKLEKKQNILSRLKEELELKRDINNATLIQYKTYNTGQKEFRDLFKRCNSNWPRFIRTTLKLEGRSFEKPQQDDFGNILSSLVCTD